jgi:quinol monooxygenase YgiN
MEVRPVSAILGAARRSSMNQHVAKQVIVAGHLIVDPASRAEYLDDCGDVVRQARRATGCLDFAISADLLEPGRINVFERWESQAAVEAFRGTGPSDDQNAAILSASVQEYDVNPPRSIL